MRVALAWVVDPTDHPGPDMCGSVTITLYGNEVCTHLHLNITVHKPRRKRRIPGLLLFHTYAPCAINVLKSH